MRTASILGLMALLAVGAAAESLRHSRGDVGIVPPVRAIVKAAAEAARSPEGGRRLYTNWAGTTCSGVATVVNGAKNTNVDVGGQCQLNKYMGVYNEWDAGTSTLTYKLLQCSESTTCSNNACVTPTAIGEACTTNEQCQTWVYDDYMCASNVCSKNLDAGEACTATADCASSLTCTDGVCKGAAAGATCSASITCDAGLYCAPATSTCTQHVAVGADCSSDATSCPEGTWCTTPSGGGTKTCEVWGTIATGANFNGQFFVSSLGVSVVGAMCASTYMNPQTGDCAAVPTGLAAAGAACTTTADCEWGTTCVCTGSDAGVCKTNQYSPATIHGALLYGACTGTGYTGGACSSADSAFRSVECSTTIDSIPFSDQQPSSYEPAARSTCTNGAGSVGVAHVLVAAAAMLVTLASRTEW